MNPRRIPKFHAVRNRTAFFLVVMLRFFTYYQ